MPPPAGGTDVPWTNNVTERAIGGIKIMYKTVSGYKAKTGC